MSVRNHTPPDWNTYGPLIQELRLGRMTLKAIRVLMDRVFDFSATEDQYRQKFEEMGDLQIYLRADAKKTMIDMLEARAREGKDTRFIFNGKPVPQKTLTRRRKVLTIQHLHAQGQSNSPPQIQYFTPPEESPIGEMVGCSLSTDDAAALSSPLAEFNIISDGHGNIDTTACIYRPDAKVFLYPEGKGFEVYLNPASTDGGVIAKVYWPAGTYSCTVEITSNSTRPATQEPFELPG